MKTAALCLAAFLVLPAAAAEKAPVATRLYRGIRWSDTIDHLQVVFKDLMEVTESDGTEYLEADKETFAGRRAKIHIFRDGESLERIEAVIPQGWIENPSEMFGVLTRALVTKYGAPSSSFSTIPAAGEPRVWSETWVLDDTVIDLRMVALNGATISYLPRRSTVLSDF